MLRSYRVTVGLLAMAFSAGIVVGHATLVKAADKNRVFEIRTYTTNEGKLPALVERMGHGEGKAFERAGMKPIGFFVAAEAPKSDNTFIYILSHESREKAKESWSRFAEDPEWKALKKSSEVAGPLVTKAEAVFVSPTDFSQLK